MKNDIKLPHVRIEFMKFLIQNILNWISGYNNFFWYSFLFWLLQHMTVVRPHKHDYYSNYKKVSINDTGITFGIWITRSFGDRNTRSVFFFFIIFYWYFLVVYICFASINNSLHCKNEFNLINMLENFQRYFQNSPCV